MARAHIVHLLGTSGRNFWLHDLVCALDRAGWSLSVLTVAPPGQLHEDLARDGIPARSLQLGRTIGLPRAAARLRRELAMSSPQIVHIHQQLPALIARLASIGRPERSVLTRHEQPGFARIAPLPAWKRSAIELVDSAAVRWPDLVIAPSARARDELAALGVPQARLRSIPLGFDLETIARTDPSAIRAARGRWGTPAGPLVVSVGRLSWEKDHHTLLRGWQRLVAERPDARLVICGEGPLRSALERLAAGLGISGSVALPGFRRDVRAILAAADVVVQTSLTESTGMVLIESLMLARPLVTTPVGIVGEHIEDERHCRVIPTGRPDSVHAAIIEAMVDRAASHARATRGADLVRERFALASMIESYGHVYRDLLAPTAAPDVLASAPHAEDDEGRSG